MTTTSPPPAGTSRSVSRGWRVLLLGSLLAAFLAVGGCSASDAPSGNASEPASALVATCTESNDEAEPVVLTGTRVSIEGDLLKVVWETGGPEAPFPDVSYALFTSTRTAEALNNTDDPGDDSIPVFWLAVLIRDGVVAPDGLYVLDATSENADTLWTGEGGTADVSGATVTATMPLSATPGIESSFRWKGGILPISEDGDYEASDCPRDGSFLEYPPQ
jgi:hypothetical protein